MKMTNSKEEKNSFQRETALIKQVDPTWSFSIFSIYSIFTKKAINKEKFKEQGSVHVIDLRRTLSWHGKKKATVELILWKTNLCLTKINLLINKSIN